MADPIRKRMAQVERDVAHANSLIPRVLASLINTVATGYSGGGGDGRGGGEFTSVEGAAISRQRNSARYQTIDSLTRNLAGTLEDLLSELGRVPDIGVDTADDAAKARCIGGEGDWADPTCTRIAVRNFESDLQRGQKLPLCWSCISRRRRWNEKQQQQAS